MYLYLYKIRKLKSFIKYTLREKYNFIYFFGYNLKSRSLGQAGPIDYSVYNTDTVTGER